MGKLIPIIGTKDQGKTTLILALIKELISRGYDVGTIKHTSHKHDLDTEGKDSFRQHSAGAEPAAVVSQSAAALYFTPLSDNAALRQLKANFVHCDFILMEGWKKIDGPKIEVWREEKGRQPLALKNTNVVLMVGDKAEGMDEITNLPFSKIKDIVDYILANKRKFKEYA